MTSVVVGSLLSIYFARKAGDGRGGRARADRSRFPAVVVAAKADSWAPAAKSRCPTSPVPRTSSEPQLEETLDTVTSAVARTEPLLFSETIDATNDTAADARLRRHAPAGTTGTGGGRGTGCGTGTGSGIGPGSGGGSGGGVYRAEPEREIRFEPKNLLEYAQFLDFFKIELGVLGQDNKIYYAYNLSQKTPSVRAGEPGDELRFYMNSARGRFAVPDRRLAGRAQIADKGRIILQFYPDPAYAILQQLERGRAESAGHRPEEIRRTIFRVTHAENRFEFDVMDQSYR